MPSPSGQGLLHDSTLEIGRHSYTDSLSLISERQLAIAFAYDLRPVRVFANGLRSDYGTPEIDNADNGFRGDGAIWDMTDDLDGLTVDVPPSQR